MTEAKYGSRIAARIRCIRNHVDLRLTPRASDAVVGQDAFLRGGQQVHRLEPDMQRDLAALDDGADRDRELAAGVALEKAWAMLCAEQLCDAFTERTAVRADRAVRPDARLEPLAG
jgi:hypothetical protein